MGTSSYVQMSDIELMADHLVVTVLIDGIYQTELYGLPGGNDEPSLVRGLLACSGIRWCWCAGACMLLPLDAVRAQPGEKPAALLVVLPVWRTVVSACLQVLQCWCWRALLPSGMPYVPDSSVIVHPVTCMLCCSHSSPLLSPLDCLDSSPAAPPPVHGAQAHFQKPALQLLSLNSHTAMPAMPQPPPWTVQMPNDAAMYSFPATAYSSFPLLRVVTESFIAPVAFFDIQLDSLDMALKWMAPVEGAYEHWMYRSERVLVSADDGLQVPLSIMYK